MRHILAFLLILTSSCVFGAISAGDTLLNVRNDANDGYVGRFVPKPASAADGIFIWSGAGNIPWSATMDSSLAYNGTSIGVVTSALTGIPQSGITGLSTTLASKANTSSLATVATTGNYNDLSNKPSSFSAPSKSTLSAPTLASVYQPSTTRWATITTSGRLDTSISLAGASEAYLLYETCPTSAFSSGNVEEGRIYNGNGGTLVVGLTLQQKVGGQVCFKVPPGYYWRVTQVNVSTGGGTPSPTLYAGTQTLEF